MIKDRELMKKYGNQGMRNGFVNLSTLGYHQQGEYSDEAFLREEDSWFKPDGAKTWYHVKFSDKYRTDSHVLLSRICRKLGIEAPSYMPAKYCMDGRDYLVSQSIFKGEDTSCVNRTKLPNFDKDGIFAPKSLNGETPISFTPQGMKDLLKARLFDGASSNISNNYGNYVLTTNNSGKISHVGMIDFAKSGSVFKHYNEELKLDEFDDCFENYASYQKHYIENKDETISQIKENEAVLELYYPRSEMVRDFGSVDVQKIRDDIASQTFYQVDQRYTDMVARSFDEFANDLSK